MNRGKEIYISIRKHLEGRNLNPTELHSPPEVFQERFNNLSFENLGKYREAITQKLICVSKNGEDLNPLELSLIEFMEQNEDLYSHPHNNFVKDNCIVVETKIEELENIYFETIKKLVLEKSENTSIRNSITEVVQATKPQLKNYSINDLTSGNVSFDLYV